MHDRLELGRMRWAKVLVAGVGVNRRAGALRVPAWGPDEKNSPQTAFRPLGPPGSFTSIGSLVTLSLCADLNLKVPANAPSLACLESW